VFTPLNSEDGLGAPIMAAARSSNDYALVMAGKEVLFVAGEAVAKSDGVTRHFQFCAFSTGGALTRCAVLPDIHDPPLPQCLTNPWAISPSSVPNPMPAPYPTSPL
jgi:hypothetical protein